MAEWSLLTEEYKSWTLSDIKEMPPRERKNWIEISRIHV